MAKEELVCIHSDNDQHETVYHVIHCGAPSKLKNPSSANPSNTLTRKGQRSPARAEQKRRKQLSPILQQGAILL